MPSRINNVDAGQRGFLIGLMNDSVRDGMPGRRLALGHLKQRQKQKGVRQRGSEGARGLSDTFPGRGLGLTKNGFMPRPFLQPPSPAPLSGPQMPALSIPRTSRDRFSLRSLL